MGKQQEILYLPEKGHNVLVGPAGSGKSLCAIFRAIYLQRITNEDIVVLAYNKALKQYLSYLSNYSRNLKICTYHSFVWDILKLNGRKVVSCNVNKIGLIKEAIKIVNKNKNNSTLERFNFICDEITWMQRMGLLDKESYLSAERTGRGRGSLKQENRAIIFEVYKKYKELRKQKKNCGYDFDDIAYYCFRYFKKNDVKCPYKHFIIDEVQDFSPMMIKSISELIKGNGSLMVFGDNAQQIYGNKLSWKETGLSVRKIYHLDVNYRNSIEIEKFSNEFRALMDLEEDEQKYEIYSKENSELPEVIEFEDKNDEIDFVLKKARILSTTRNLVIIVMTKQDQNMFLEKLKRLNIEPNVIDKDTHDFKKKNCVYVGTLFSTKGLEFDTVIIPFCTDNNLQNKLKDRDLTQDDIKVRITKLMYVAITRAMKRLYITHTGPISTYFPKQNDSLYNKFKYFDQNELNSEIKERGITRLCHFTKSKNLSYIFSDDENINGILASNCIEKEFKDPNDLVRYDKRTDHINCSIQYPNFTFLQVCRKQEKLFKDMVILCIKPEVIMRKNTLFCKVNAATNNGEYIKAGIELFRELFQQHVVAFNSKSKVKEFSREIFLPDNCTTDNQAEVMIYKKIPKELIQGIIVRSDFQARQELARLELNNINCDNIKIYVLPEMFDVHTLDKLNEGIDIKMPKEFVR